MKNRFLSYKFIDASGNLRDKIIRKTRGRLKPSWFDGSSFGFMPTNNSDLMLEPDKKSLHFDPIRMMASYFCFLRKADGYKLETDFRRNAFDTMDEDEETRGALFGVEPEFFICKRKAGILIPIDVDDKFDLKDEKQTKWYGCLPPIDSFQNLRYEIANALEAAGLYIEGIHHEVAPGQCEFSWKCANLLKTCDQMMLYKYIVTNVCAKYELEAVWEAKPFQHLNGNGCHVHQSLPMMKPFRRFDTNQVDSRKDIIEKYAQGLVNHYDELLEACCVGKSSLDRLVPGFEAPTKDNNGFGVADRTKTVRIPGGGGRVEFRLPDPDMNPYIALPMMLRFGYESVRQQRKPNNTEGDKAE